MIIKYVLNGCTADPKLKVITLFFKYTIVKFVEFTVATVAFVDASIKRIAAGKELLFTLLSNLHENQRGTDGSK